MKLKFLLTSFTLIVILFISNSTFVWAKGREQQRRDRAQPKPAPEEDAFVNRVPVANETFDQYMNATTWGKNAGNSSGGSENSTGKDNGSNDSGVEGSGWGWWALDPDGADSSDLATLKNHGIDNKDAANMAFKAGKLCGHLNADGGPDYEKCRRDVILYNATTEDARDEKGLIPLLAKSKSDYVGAMGQGGASPKDTMELGSKFDAAMGLVMLTRGSRADGAQEANSKAAKENRIMAVQNERQIAAIDAWNQTHKNNQKTVQVAEKHAAQFKSLANTADKEAAKWDDKQWDARWTGLAMLGMGYFQHDLARKFDDDAEKRITDPVGQVQPGLGLQPFAQNNPQPIPQTEYFGEQKQDPEANGYDKTGAEVGSGNAASTGQLGLSQLSPSQPERENSDGSTRSMDDDMGLSRYSSSDGGASGNDDIKKYLDSVFGKNQGEGSAASHKSPEFGNPDENLAKIKALGKNEDIFKYISRIHKEQLGS